MDLVKTFKKIIIIYFSYVVLLIPLVIFIDWSIPLESVPETTIIDIVFIFIAFIFLINLFFLYKLKSFSRHLFLALVVLMAFFPYGDLFLNPNYEYLGKILYNIEYTIIGMIITFLYFTDLKEKFN